MSPEKFTLPFERPIVDAIKKWPESFLSAMLIALAIFLVWVAMQKDHVVLKSVLLGWILLP